MTALRCADPAFGINPQALAILQLLAGTEPAFADFNPITKAYDCDVRTYPWYNGLERGVALVVLKNAQGPCLVVTFGECRDSDHLFVEHWNLREAPVNGPRVEDETLDQGSCRALFKRGRFEEIVDHVLGVMTAYYDRLLLMPAPKALLRSV